MGLTTAAEDDSPGVAHALARRGGLAGDKDHHLLAVNGNHAAEFGRQLNSGNPSDRIDLNDDGQANLADANGSNTNRSRSIMASISPSCLFIRTVWK